MTEHPSASLHCDTPLIIKARSFRLLASIPDDDRRLKSIKTCFFLLIFFFYSKSAKNNLSCPSRKHIHIWNSSKSRNKKNINYSKNIYKNTL